MGLVAQWSGIADGLPERWADVQLRLSLDRPETANRAAVLLGPIGPGRAGGRAAALDLGGRQRPGPAPPAAGTPRRRGHPGLARADLRDRRPDRGRARRRSRRRSRGVCTARGRLGGARRVVAGRLERPALHARAAVDGRPAPGRARDRAPQPLAPRSRSRLPFPCRAEATATAPRPEMAQRCLARLDERTIPGQLRLVEALSDTRPVATQGPTFIVDNRAV